MLRCCACSMIRVGYSVWGSAPVGVKMMDPQTPNSNFKSCHFTFMSCVSQLPTTTSPVYSPMVMALVAEIVDNAVAPVVQ